MCTRQAEGPPREITREKRLFKLRLTPTLTQLFRGFKFCFFLTPFRTLKDQKATSRGGEGGLRHSEGLLTRTGRVMAAHG